MKNNKILIGVIIDVSASMKENWHNPSKKNLPKIEVLTQLVNDYFKKLSLFENNQEIDVFCLGLGLSIKIKNTIYEAGKDIEERINERYRVVSYEGHVIDFITLGKSLPKKFIIEDLQKELSKLWNIYADELMKDISVDAEAENNLYNLLIEDIYHLTKTRFRYKFNLRINNSKEGYLKKILVTLIKATRFSLTENILREKAEKIINNLIIKTKETSTKIFTENNTKYKSIIEEKIKSFAQKELKLILERQALGFDNKAIIQKFDKQKMRLLQGDIYSSIKKDFKSNFDTTWILVNTLLRNDRFWLKFTLLPKKGLKEAIENLIHYLGWKDLKTHVEQVIKNLFEVTFRQELSELLSTWVYKSIYFHQTEKLNSISNLLPNGDNSFDMNFNKIMFGSSTPIDRAINFASSHFNNEQYKNHKKYLLIFSDGDFEESKEYIEVTDMLKNEGVIIGGLLLSQKNIVRKIGDIVGKGGKHKNFTKICSQVKDIEKLNNHFKSKHINISDQNRLIFQVNSSENFEPILDFILAEE